MDTFAVSQNSSIKRNHNLLKIKNKLEQKLRNGGKSQTNEDAQELHRTLMNILENLEENDSLPSKIQNIYDKMTDRIETKEGHLPEKYFMQRNSILTDLAEVRHLRTMRSVFVVVLISLLIDALSKDVVKKGTITLGYHQILEGYTNFHMAVFTWICMLFSTFGVYGAFLFWGTVRAKLLDKPKSYKFKLWDTFWLTSFAIYYLVFLYFTVHAVIANSLQIIASKLIILEMIRMVMKTYAFVRSNAPTVLKYKLHDEDKILCPKFSNFLYFSFAPTLIYKDSYPRTTHIRWNYVASCFVQIFAASVCLHLIQEYTVVYSFKEYDLKNITWKDVLLLISGNTIPCMFYFLCWLFIICHASQNAAAEMLRFGDRLFYKDWWNSTSVEEIFTGWNVIVYDWFYTYIYKDMYEVVVPRNRTAAKLVEYCLMLIFHELIYGFPYRFYSPVMFFVYIIGVSLLSSLKYKNDLLMNSLILYALTSGAGLVRTSLFLEYYVRIECPVENATTASYFIPRTHTCNLA